MPEILNQAIESVPLSALKTHPKNPRRGDLERIVESITVNGFYGHVIAQRSTGHILVGNHRFLAAKKAKLKKVPVLWLDVDDEKAERILVVDNRTSDLAEYDEEALARLLERLADDTELGIAGLGFTDEELEDMLTALEPEMENTNAPTTYEPPPTTVTSEPGEVVNHVRQVHLFLSAETIQGFLEHVTILKDIYKLDNVSDTVLEAVRYAHSRYYPSSPPS